MSASTPDWRPFLRALAEELDAVAGVAGRDTLLHAVGSRMAALYPVLPRDSAEGLSVEMNEALASFGLGAVEISFSETEHCLLLAHRGLPRIGGGGTPPGTWLAALLEGLFEGWMGQQPGADATFSAHRAPSDSADDIVVRYGPP
jgi:hypothetical protein